VPQTVTSGAAAAQPTTAPTAPAGQQFAGWYADAACTKPFDFANTPITGDTTVYAKYTSIPTYTISGTVYGLVAPLSNQGVTISYTINGTAGSVKTDANGYYSITGVPYDANVVITTPANVTGYNPATPAAGWTLTNINNNIIKADFTYAPVVVIGSYTITGNVSGLTDNSNVTINYTVNGTAGSTVTDAQGDYSIQNVPAGATVAIAAPANVTGYNPATPTAGRSLKNISADNINQNFVYVLTVPVYTVTGKLQNLPTGVDPTTLAVSYVYTDPTTGKQINGSVSVDATGSYSIPNVPTGAVVTVVPPTVNGVTPDSIKSDPLTGNLPNQNFDYSPVTYTISGNVSGLLSNQGVTIGYTINGKAGVATTDQNGNYSIPGVPAGTTVVITAPSNMNGYNPATPTAGYTQSNVSANITQQDFVYTAASLLTNNAIWYLRGYPDGTIQPEGTITRAEVAMAIYRLLTPDALAQAATAKNVTYSDVTSDKWYYIGITTLSNLGVVSGYPDGSFKPDVPITRSEMAVILTNLFEIAPASAAPFTDVTSSNWAYQYIANDYASGLIVGDGNGTFRPNDNLKRAEFATMMNRLLGRSVDSTKLTLTVSSQIAKFSDLLPTYWGYNAMVAASNSYTFSGTDVSGNQIWTAVTGNGLTVPFQQ
jgi:uncharacterized repeat protein (TIGR02543 family)